METRVYTIGEIAGIIHSQTAAESPAWVINSLVTDSRKLTLPAQTLFFALRGKQDGHAYIGALLEAGVRNFVVADTYDLPLNVPSGTSFLKVGSVLDALQLLAKAHRAKFTYPVIGITGSNGKTIVKEWLFQLLSPDKHIIRSPKSYNSQIGVPLSVWEMNDHYDLALFEAGISQPGEMIRLLAIIEPDIGILTNIGSAHDMGFAGREEKVREKVLLFERAQVLIYSRDYVNVSFARKTFTWSFHRDADLKVTSLEPHLFNTSIRARYQGKNLEIEIPFTDGASVENAVICWSTLLYMGYGHEEIARRMLLLAPIAMRMELKQALGNCSVINDSYNFDLPSLRIALDFLNQQTQHGKKTVIFSDMLQTGVSERELYTELSYLLKNKQVNRIVGIGEAVMRNADLFMQEKQFFPSTESFLEAFDTSVFQNEAILIKGARVFGFERISRLFERKVHDTVLEINLNAVISNYNYFKSLLNPSTKIMAMVKAFSYGSGSFEVASILQYHRIDYLAVAYADEGISLRNSGIETPILILNPEVSTFSALVKYRLEPEIYSMRILTEFITFLQAERVPVYQVHLKLDTGMHRLGFMPEEINDLKEVLSQESVLKVRGIFSHLASSEDPSDDSFTQRQITLFNEMSGDIMSILKYKVIRHLANTAAISRFPNAHFDMVRLGIGLYGLASGGDNGLQHVATLKTSISQIHSLKAGESVGYNRMGKVERDSRVATVKIGYADGYRRALGNGKGYMLVKGYRAPVIGNVCMDMCMIDITGVDCRETDEVIVFGEYLPVKLLASWLATNEYEVVTSISQRVKRVYLYE